MSVIRSKSASYPGFHLSWSTTSLAVLLTRVRTYPGGSLSIDYMLYFFKFLACFMKIGDLARRK